MSTPVVETDRLVRAFIRIRNTRAEIKEAYTEQDEDLQSKLKTIEIELLRRAQDQGVEGFTTKDGTTYIAEDVHVSIGDADTFTAFLEEEDDPFGYYEQRVSLKRVKEYQSNHEGAAPPGIKLFRENRMRVRAAKKKSTKAGEADES